MHSSHSTGKRLLEEYRYDALGRRVMVRGGQGCAPTDPLECGTSGTQRVVWDGSDVVAELRSPIDSVGTEELNSGIPLLPMHFLQDPNPFFGRVVYAPGLAVDEPLSVTRYEYKDRIVPTSPNQPMTLSWPTFTVLPFYDYRGTPVAGLFSNGWERLPYSLGWNSWGTGCPSTPWFGGTERCVYLGWSFAQDPLKNARGGVMPLSWHGSVLANKKDGSGLHYMRNRQYDPGTGRFTQEDPIGLAGGLNTYGFANGDPVNFGDPFGLFPIGAAAAAARLACSTPIGARACTAAAAKVGQELARSQAVREAMARSRELGRGGERAVGRVVALAKNYTVKLGTRVPDFVDEAEGYFNEVKNVSRQAFTRQLREMLQATEATGNRLVLWVRQTTVLTEPMQDAVDVGRVILQYIPKP